MRDCDRLVMEHKMVDGMERVEGGCKAYKEGLNGEDNPVQAPDKKSEDDFCHQM
jgi:hypothetical protein